VNNTHGAVRGGEVDITKLKPASCTSKTTVGTIATNTLANAKTASDVVSEIDISGGSCE